MQLQQKFIWPNETFEVYADQNLYHDQTVLDKSAPVEKKKIKKERENRAGENATVKINTETVSMNSTRGKKEVEADFKCRQVAGN